MKSWTTWMCAAAVAGSLLGIAQAMAAADDRTVGEREAEMTASALLKQNEDLKAEVARLGKQVKQLSVSLAEAKLEADLLRTEQNRAQWAAAKVPVSERPLDGGEMKVLDVNQALGLVVFGAGTESGIRPGMTLSVVRENAAIASVRTIDVRDEISGAVVEKTTDGKFPEKGDRIVAGRASEQ